MPLAGTITNLGNRHVVLIFIDNDGLAHRVQVNLDRGGESATFSVPLTPELVLGWTYADPARRCLERAHPDAGKLPAGSPQINCARDTQRGAKRFSVGEG